MNWSHLQTILWLRWRISLNQLRRSGIASTIILAFLATLILVSSISLFFVALFVGIATLHRATPEVLMYLWDGIVFVFIMFWMIGLLAELQRAEVLSLQKLLHLPVSLSGTFLINYLGSLVSLTMVVLLPGMIAFCIAMVVAKGAAMLFALPLLAGFLLMVTAITYQFQGWLAALMVNQRKRRTVIVVVTMLFVLVFQLPNLFNLFFQGKMRRTNDASTKMNSDLQELEQARRADQITAEEYNEKSALLQTAYKEKLKQDSAQQQEKLKLYVSRVNLFLPFGWLPYGTMACAAGNLFPAILGTIGSGLIGAISLRRSYRTTMRLYTGQFSSGTAQPVQPVRTVPVVPAKGMRFLEKRLPLLSEHASSIALANFRSLTRAPEAKMILLSPVIMIIVFGSMLLTRSMTPPQPLRPVMGLGVVAMILLTTMQLIGNQFGLDRDGFRVLVLCCAPRRDILLGKNISIAPLSLGLSILGVTIVQALYPMRPTHLLATLAELISLFLICGLIGNFTSILAPMPVAAGSLKPAHPKAMSIIIHLLFFFVFPVVIGIAMVPLGLELLLHHFGWLNFVPIYLLGSWVQLALTLVIYHYLIDLQGGMLQSREQKILAIVTSKVE